MNLPQLPDSFVCRKCGYDLTHPTGDSCPECGAPVATHRAKPPLPLPLSARAAMLLIALSWGYQFYIDAELWSQLIAIGRSDPGLLRALLVIPEMSMIYASTLLTVLFPLAFLVFLTKRARWAKIAMLICMMLACVLSWSYAMELLGIYIGFRVRTGIGGWITPSIHLLRLVALLCAAAAVWQVRSRSARRPIPA